MFGVQFGSAGVRAYPAHRKVYAYIRPARLFEFEIVFAFAELLCGKGIYRERERFFRGDGKAVFHAEVFRAVMTSRFLRADISPVVVFVRVALVISEFRRRAFIDVTLVRSETNV